MMEITVSEDMGLVLKDFYSGITLKHGETEISICSRDFGFEMTLDGGQTWFSIRGKEIKELNPKIDSEFLAKVYTTCPTCGNEDNDHCPNGFHNSRRILLKQSELRKVEELHLTELRSKKCSCKGPITYVTSDKINYCKSCGLRLPYSVEINHPY